MKNMTIAAIDPISCGFIHTVSAPNPFPVSQLHSSDNNPKPFFNSSCETVKAPQPNSFQQLAALQSAVLQTLYFSTLLITKTLSAPLSIIHNE